MPVESLQSKRLHVKIDGRLCPDISVALLDWILTERPARTMTGELEVAYTDAAAIAVDSLRLGASIGLTLASEPVFDGWVTTLEGRVGHADLPSVVLHLRGQRVSDPSSIDSVPLVMRVGAEVLRARVRQEGSPVVLHMSAEITEDFATGAGAVRTEQVVDLVGMGPLFDGPFQMQQVALRCDQTRGLVVEVLGSGDRNV